MFCPKCGSKNLDDAKFCRACGVDISLVPEAITGKVKKRGFGFEPLQPKGLESLGEQMGEIGEMFGSLGSCGVGGRPKRSEPSIERAIINLFIGVGFLFVAVALALFGQGVQGHRWWFWMLIPAFALMGTGVAEIVRLRFAQRSAPGVNPTNAGAPTTAFAPAPQANELPPRDTSEIFAPPPSITESTTRHLDPQSAQAFEKVPVRRSGENL